MLTSEQAKKNQQKYGWNELIEGKKKSVIHIFLEQFKDFLVIILIIAAIASGFLGDFESSVVIFVVITMNAILGTVQTVKANQSLNSLKQLSAPEAKVVRDGKTIKIPSREVTVGDYVMIEAGDCIPADGKLIECASLKVDESALTGESLSVEKSLEMVEENVALADQTNRVFSGSFVTYGRASYEVTEIGMSTEVGKIANLLKNTSEKRTPLQINLDDFGKKLSILILIFCGVLFVLNVMKGGEIVDAFLFAVALAVAAIPEALSSIVTIVLSFGTQKMAKEHAIIRKLQAVEGLGSVSVICSDKTGTLTQNRMTVENYYVDNKIFNVDNLDFSNRNVEFLFLSSILCNDSQITNEHEIGDPTETALLQVGVKYERNPIEIKNQYVRNSEIPFDSERKLMSTSYTMLHNGKEREIMIVKGAVDVLLKRISYIQKGDTVRKITEEDIMLIERQNIEFSSNGLRILAFAYKEVEKNKELQIDDESELIFMGLISMMDPPREESKLAVEECIRAGIKPIMITGDHKITASAIAKKIGILQNDSEACEGAVIEEMSDEELQDFVEGISVYARVSPEHKIRIVRAWQEKGNIVAMTGDGVNDAPALKQADIGVAMGITGSEVSKDAAAMVLTDDNFATIVKAIENGRNIYQNIKNSIQFLLSGNFGGILVVLFASLVSLPVPFEPVHLLFINLLTDSLPAIALGLEPHSEEVMKEKPRPTNESILTKDYLMRIGMEGLVIAVMTCIGFLLGYHKGGAALASTMAFGTLCSSRLVHGFNCKSKKPVIFSKKMWNNISLIAAFIVGMILITVVMMIPGFHSIFKVVTLNASQMFTIHGLAFMNLPVIQFMKFIRQRADEYGN